MKLNKSNYSQVLSQMQGGNVFIFSEGRILVLHIRISSHTCGVLQEMEMQRAKKILGRDRTSLRVDSQNKQKKTETEKMQCF